MMRSGRLALTGAMFGAILSAAALVPNPQIGEPLGILRASNDFGSPSRRGCPSTPNHNRFTGVLRAQRAARKRRNQARHRAACKR